MGQQNARYPARKKEYRWKQSIRDGGCTKAIRKTMDALLMSGVRMDGEAGPTFRWVHAQVIPVDVGEGLTIFKAEPIAPQYIESLRQKINESGRAFIGKSFPLEKYIREARVTKTAEGFLPGTLRYDGCTPDSEHFVTNDFVTYKYTFSPPMEIK